MTLAKVREQDGMTHSSLLHFKRTKHDLNHSELSTMRVTLFGACAKEFDHCGLAKVREQDGMTFAKVRHAQVSHVPH